MEFIALLIVAGIIFGGGMAFGGAMMSRRTSDLERALGAFADRRNWKGDGHPAKMAREALSTTEVMQ